MTTKVQNIGVFGVATGNIPPSGSTGIVTTNNYTLFTIGIIILDPVVIGGIGNSASGKTGVTGALEELFKSIGFDVSNSHTHEATENQFATRQSAVCCGGVTNDVGIECSIKTGIRAGDIVFVDAGVHEFAEADLLEFAYAVGAAGAFTGGGEGGQQHGSQNRDDSDYHQSRIQRENAERVKM